MPKRGLNPLQGRKQAARGPPAGSPDAAPLLARARGRPQGRDFPHHQARAAGLRHSPRRTGRGEETQPDPAAAGVHRASTAPPTTRSTKPRGSGGAPMSLTTSSRCSSQAPRQRGFTRRSNSRTVGGHPSPATAGVHRPAKTGSRCVLIAPQARGLTPVVQAPQYQTGGKPRQDVLLQPIRTHHDTTGTRSPQGHGQPRGGRDNPEGPPDMRRQ